MPLKRVKKVWDYCTYNKAFFLLVMVLFVALNYVKDYADWEPISYLIIYVLASILISGYGMSITRDRIHEGYRLPKIMIKDVFLLGIKSSIVFSIYILVQSFILDLVCSPLDFPDFNLEELLLEFPDTMNMLFSHNIVHAALFLIFGALFFYITAFFMEIALARLADTGKMRSSFNLFTIKNVIDRIGWRNYAIDYTLIVLAIVFFAFLKHIVVPFTLLNYVWDTILDLFIFATQYMGIGAVYAISKNKDSKTSEE